MSPLQVVNSFEGMKLRDPLLRGVYAFGFSTPSAIQQRAILPITQGQQIWQNLVYLFTCAVRLP